MSAGRKHRRRMSRNKVIYRPVAVELSHETREWVARVIAAHDDDNVDLEEMRDLCIAFSEYTHTLPYAERVEATMQFGDHTSTAIAGIPVRTLALITSRHGMPTVIARRVA